MPHVSKTKLKEREFIRIYDQFIDTVSVRNDKKHDALDDLLTKTEKIMLAKRLAAIFMILEGASIYNIENTLHVSSSTATRFTHSWQRGKYDHIEYFFRTKKRRREFWDSLEVIIRAGMPPMGRGRWRWLYEMDEKYK